MSNPCRKTLFEIVYNVLQQFDDVNLKSDEAKKRIADEVCNRYYDCADIEFQDGEYNNVTDSIDDIIQQGE